MYSQKFHLDVVFWEVDGVWYLQCAFFKIPKATDISELKSVFLLHYKL